MNDMSSVIVAKSDQWNADDFTAGPRIFVIEDVAIRPGTEQPVSIKLAGSDKVFRPCKTVSRVLVAAWGADANEYRGRSIELYTDPAVTWGGMKVGGIRVSRMSHLDKALVIALQEKKGSRKMTTVQPLKVEPQTDAAAEWADKFIAGLDHLRTPEAITAEQSNNAKSLAKIEKNRPELHERIGQAIDARLAFLSGEKRGDEDLGDGFDGGDA